MTELTYFSPSQIQRFRRCPRSWFHRYVLGEREPETEAQAVGKAMHAELEAWWAEGVEPTGRLARAVIANMPFLPTSPDVLDSAVEADTESSGFQLAGLPMRGYIDLQVWTAEGLTILDYKTTSGWKWAKGVDALRADVQMNLYAGWAFFRHPELEHVTIGHLAVCKKTSEARWTPVVFKRADVRRFCEGVVATLREMIATAALGPEGVDQVEQVETACGAYGGCSYRGACWPTDTTRYARLAAAAQEPRPMTTNKAPLSTAQARLQALKARKAASALAPEVRAQQEPAQEPQAPPVAHAFLPPDAMPDLEPEPLDVRPIADVLPKGALDGAAARGLHTVADLLSFLAFGGELSDIKGVGPKAVAGIAGELSAISKLWPTPRLRLRRALDVYAQDADADAAHLPAVRGLRGAL